MEKIYEVCMLDEGTTFEEESNILRNVKLLNPVSSNGYEYLQSAINEALPMYKNKPIYYNHIQKGQTFRDYSTHGGTVLEAREDKVKGGARGDLQLKPHKNREAVVYDFLHNTPNVGISQSVLAIVNENKKVEKIDAILSCDIVCCPATTSSFREAIEIFENLDENKILENQIEELKQQLNELKLSITDLNKEKPVAFLGIPQERPKEMTIEDWVKNLRLKRRNY